MIGAMTPLDGNSGSGHVVLSKADDDTSYKS